jgi:predicted aldo/keto reductase-like oxidoreductase
MEFCQLQLNYLDWTFQHGKEKVELLRRWGIPVWVMEPLRGGKLAKLQPEHEAALKALRPDEEIPAWAFRFLQSIPSVTVILSGMSSQEQLEKNLRTFAEDKPLTEAEMKTLTDIANTTNGKFYRARNAEELREIYHEIDKLEKSKIEVQRYSRRYEDYQKYGLIALGALLLEILLRITIFRRIP